jgi:putative transposase
VPFKRVPRLRSFDYLGANRYFLTFCTWSRQLVFLNEDPVAQVTTHLSQTAADRRFAVIAYCYMPDHLHVLVEGCAIDSSLTEFVRAFKQRSSFHWRHCCGKTLWQRSYYEHVLRNEESTLDVARYILENPVRAGLATRVKDYPYVGSMTLSIKDLLYSVSDDR